MNSPVLPHLDMLASNGQNNPSTHLANPTVLPDKSRRLMQIFDCDLHPHSLDVPLLGTGWSSGHIRWFIGIASWLSMHSATCFEDTR